MKIIMVVSLLSFIVGYCSYHATRVGVALLKEELHNQKQEKGFLHE